MLWAAPRDTGGDTWLDVALLSPGSPRAPLCADPLLEAPGARGGEQDPLQAGDPRCQATLLLSSLLFSMQFAFRAAGGTCSVLQPGGSSRSLGRGRWHRPPWPQVLQALCPNFLKGSAVQFPNVVWERHEN